MATTRQDAPPRSAPGGAGGGSAAVDGGDEHGAPLYSVLLPTYNERENLPIVLHLIDRSFSSVSARYEVIVVDDNSPDGTQEVLKRLQRQIYGEDTLRLAARPRRMGLGTAYVHAMNVARGRFLLVMDCDLSHHPKFIADFVRVQRRTDCDIVSGNRYVQQGGVHGWSLMRKLTSRGANFLAQVLLRPKVSDLTGSFRLYRRSAFAALVPRMRAMGYSFQVEMIVRASRAALHIEEVPITFVDRLQGESKFGSLEIVRYLRTIYELLVYP